MLGGADANASPDAGVDADDSTRASAADALPSNATGATAVTAAETNRADAPLDALIDEVLRWVDQVADDAFEGLTPRKRKLLATRIVKKAQAWSMTDPRDMAIFCALYRYPGPRFFRRRAWVDGAKRVRNGLTTWEHVFQEPQLWEEEGEEDMCKDATGFSETTGAYVKVDRANAAPQATDEGGTK